MDIKGGGTGLGRSVALTLGTSVLLLGRTEAGVGMPWDSKDNIISLARWNCSQ